MRSGRLLAEDLPQNLLKDYGLLSLENVFLKLCIKDGIEKKRDEVNIDGNSRRRRFDYILHTTFTYNILILYYHNIM